MREIISHTSLRGVAALGVAFYHHGYMVADEILGSPLGVLIYNFETLVDLFFILSGFVISYVYYKRFTQALSWSLMRDFLAARLARIYPLHLLTLLFFVATGIAQTGTLAQTFDSTFYANLFMVQAWIPGFDSLNKVSWSVSGEWAAYLCFAPMAFLLKSRWGRVVLAAFCVIAYANIWRITGDLGPSQQTHLMRALAGFALGMLGYQMRDAMGRLSGQALSAIQIALLTLITVTMAFQWSEFILPPAYLVLLLALYTDAGALGRVLCTRSLHALGLWSYGIYMLHMPVMYCVYVLRGQLPQGMLPESMLFLLISLGLTVLASALSHRFFEVPVQKAIRRAAQGKSALLKAPRH